MMTDRSVLQEATDSHHLVYAHERMDRPAGTLLSPQFVTKSYSQQKHDLLSAKKGSVSTVRIPPTPRALSALTAAVTTGTASVVAAKAQQAWKSVKAKSKTQQPVAVLEKIYSTTKGDRGSRLEERRKAAEVRAAAAAATTIDALSLEPTHATVTATTPATPAAPATTAAATPAASASGDELEWLDKTSFVSKVGDLRLAQQVYQQMRDADLEIIESSDSDSDSDSVSDSESDDIEDFEADDRIESGNELHYVSRFLHLTGV